MHNHFNIVNLTHVQCTLSRDVPAPMERLVWRVALFSLLLASVVFCRSGHAGLEGKTALDPSRVQNAKYPKLRYLVYRSTVEIN